MDRKYNLRSKNVFISTNELYILYIYIYIDNYHSCISNGLWVGTVTSKNLRMQQTIQM